MSAHTPGPWDVADTDDSLITKGRTKIAMTFEVEGDVWGAANARLIAAAPELLFALKNLLAVKNGEGGTAFDSDEIARAAIAKAEGGA
jgi:hypothetical protein